MSHTIQLRWRAQIIMAVAGFVLITWPSSSAHAQWTTGTNINNTNTGNVGVGTTTPSTKLEVVGNINVKLALNAPATTDVRHIFNGASAWLGQDATNAELNFGQNLYHNNGFKYRVTGTAANIRMYLGAFQFQTAGSNSANAAISWTDSMVILANGRVGIGATGPGKKLVIQSDTANDHLSIVRPTTNAATFNIGIDNTGPFFESTTANRPISFYTHNGTSVGERVRIDKDGKVGIGIITPSKALDVVGDINATGTITGGTIHAKYQDVAEWVPSTHALPAGTVVTLDPTKSNHVEASSQAYDTRVAGVISAQPGITLGEAGENKVLVATTGRVRIKVDASHGPILVGDLLVTSDIHGVAMKSQPINVGGVEIHRPGTLVGKALEPLAKGRGEILVLLSLQ